MKESTHKSESKNSAPTLLGEFENESLHNANREELTPSPGKGVGVPVPGSTPETGVTPNPFDPETLRVSQNFSSSIGVKKILTTVACRKPSKQEFVRVRPGADWRLETGIFEDKTLREHYLVAPPLWAELSGEICPVTLFLAVNRQHDVFFWPTKMPGSDGRTNPWNESALAAARVAESKWVRVISNMMSGMYDTFEALGNLTEPEWPDLSMSELLRLCFKDRFIQDMQHPRLRAIRGEL